MATICRLSAAISGERVFETSAPVAVGNQRLGRDAPADAGFARGSPGARGVGLRAVFTGPALRAARSYAARLLLAVAEQPVGALDLDELRRSARSRSVNTTPLPPCALYTSDLLQPTQPIRLPTSPAPPPARAAARIIGGMNGPFVAGRPRPRANRGCTQGRS